MWPPDYTLVFQQRQERYLKIAADPVLQYGARCFYADHPVDFIEDWCITYDPRSAGSSKPTTLPFILFDRQKDMVQFLWECLIDGESGLIEKSRDMGATWTCCALSVHLWRFLSGASVGWGSRKESLVDKIGDPDSIFEKIRLIIDHLPFFLLPAGFDRNANCSFMKIINPENGATITGESGDNIGRGGRKSIYFKDESAHYERPEKIEAALGDNTDVQIDMSSVNGTANIFARRRQQGAVWTPGCSIPKGTIRVLVLDWREHPNKTQEWYDTRRAKAEREGLLHIFAQEVDRDYAAAVQGVVIPAAWVRSAIDLHKRVPSLLVDTGICYSGLDVADEGGDYNAQAVRKGITLRFLDQWAEGDTGQTANRAIINCKLYHVDEIDYDCIGVGSGIKAEANRLRREKQLPKGLKIVPWNAGDSVLDPEKNIVPNDPESPKNEDVLLNLRAQAWWQLRIRFEKTHKFVTQGIQYDIAELINLPSNLPLVHDLVAELSQPTFANDSHSGKIKINKKPDGTRSPNLADAVIKAYWPWRPLVHIVGVWGSKPASIGKRAQSLAPVQVKPQTKVGIF